MKITSIKQQVKRPDRYSIFVDGAFAFGLSENALLASKLASGQELDAAQLAALKKDAATDKVYGNALRYVAIRQRSEWEMRSYLTRREVDEPQIELIIERLRRVDLLNDKLFASMWVANRRLLKSTSKRRLRQELQQKHVPSSIIDQALQEDEGDERSILSTLIDRKRQRYPDVNKFMQYLARQGFGYDDIKRALDGHAEED